ncbi:16195_t:CDS:2 [Funneliformis geosporum]|uniref:16195_t:CDS:1 n=1 Tax=Funneliformis geosporum TaxID=1117311 RepID=A0A9W4SUN9_9GLOM|nr:16195_t:CDS:2 [Funneliformis geosporum]
MGKGKELTESQKDTILYEHRLGHSCRKIAGTVGCGPSAVSTCIRSEKWNINDSLSQIYHFTLVFKRNLPLSPNPNIDIEMYDNQFNENKNVFESKKYINDNVNIVELSSNVDDNDGKLSLLSSYITDNKKDIKKIKYEIVKNE